MTEQIEKLDNDITRYTYRNGKYIGRVTTYDTLYSEYSKHFPRILFLGEDGKTLLEELTVLRQEIKEFPEEKRLTMLEEWDKREHRVMGDLDVCPISGSFRRHIISTCDPNCKSIYVKIPGEWDSTREVQKENFYHAIKIWRTYGDESHILGPLMMTELPKTEYNLYGKSRFFSPKVICYQYFDGKRFSDVYPEYVDHLVKKTGMEASEIISSIATEPFKILKKIHKCKSRLSGGAVSSNFLLRENGETLFVSDFDLSPWQYHPLFWYSKWIEKKADIWWHLPDSISNLLKRLGYSEEGIEKLLEEGKRSYKLG